MKTFWEKHRAREKKEELGWRFRLHEIIFEADTATGKAFDLVLIFSIICSVILVMLDSITEIRLVHGELLFYGEWFFTILFSIEYILRIISVGRPKYYIFSFFGMVDLLAILPTYISLILPGSHYLSVIRVLRVLRIFRVLKFVQYLGEAELLLKALKHSRRKITVFLLAVFTLVVILGSIMHLIEGENNGFSSIPRSIYWAIVTLTTVGYGDISPKTNLGQLLAAIIMIIGYAIIAVPTGIVSVEYSQAAKQNVSTQACRKCSLEGHDTDATHCKYCGAEL